jgi:hypothetical protein
LLLSLSLLLLPSLLSPVAGEVGPLVASGVAVDVVRPAALVGLEEASAWVLDVAVGAAVLVAIGRLGDEGGGSSRVNALTMPPQQQSPSTAATATITFGFFGRATNRHRTLVIASYTQRGEVDRSLLADERPSHAVIRSVGQSKAGCKADAARAGAREDMTEPAGWPIAVDAGNDFDADRLPRIRK